MGAREVVLASARDGSGDLWVRYYYVSANGTLTPADDIAAASAAQQVPIRDMATPPTSSTASAATINGVTVITAQSGPATACYLLDATQPGPAPIADPACIGVTAPAAEEQPVS